VLHHSIAISITKCQILISRFATFASQAGSGWRAREDVAVLIPFYTGEVVSQVPGKGQHSFGDAQLRLNYALATLCSVAKFFHGEVVVGVRARRLTLSRSAGTPCAIPAVSVRELLWN
jgi:hypothetical protein